jgi:hypothetical protein
MFAVFLVVLAAVVLAIPVNLLHRLWSQSLAKAIYDALAKPGPAPVPPPTTPASGS